MTTFSELVDSMVSELRRPDLGSEIARYLNQTIRECHFDPVTNAAQFFKSNTVEATIAATSESAQVWTPPCPQNFQKLSAVEYPTIGIWPEETTPGRHLRGKTHYYYQVGGSFVFSDYGGVGGQINLFYFVFPHSLTYFAESCRPMQCSLLGEKVYAEEWIHDHSREDADLLCTNWLLMSWKTVLEEGVRAKVYKRLSDTERARTAYSLYAQLRRGLVTSESAVLSPVF